MKFYANTFFALALLGASTGSVWSQRHVCGFDESFQHALTDPRVRAEYERCEQMYQQSAQSGQRTTGGNVRIIPTVFHFIQTSADMEVNDAAVYSQLEVLNEDFRKLAGTPGFGNGVDMEYEFCLASIDPNGAPTTGINRVIAPAYAFHDKVDEAAMKALIHWDPHSYFNIWITRTIETTSGAGQVIGYATFPSSITFQANLDGVVIHSGYFGRNADPTTQGETAVHEAGHWIGLFHTFQNGCQGSSAGTCLTGGDRVCDTPQAFDQNFGCPVINSCTDSPTDAFDQIENYMDYSDGTCQNMYTAGQKTRADQIVANYRSNIYSASNLSATGCDGTPAPGAAPWANYRADHRYACVNQPVNFTDLSYGPANAWNWTFQGGTPATSTDQNPVVIYNTPGTYNVTLSVANNLGGDSEARTGYITITAPAQPFITEGFETSTNLPTGWNTVDEDSVGTWSVVSNAGSQGTSKCVKVKNYKTYTTGLDDDLNLVPMDFTNVVTSSMTYDWAYRKYSGFTYDSLQVNVSTDCGLTWTNLRNRVQGTLVTVGGLLSASEFLPTLTTQWKTDTLDLNSYAGMPSVQIQFKMICQNGQSLYLDNVNINNSFVGAAEEKSIEGNFQVSPNPFQNEFNIDYTIHKSGSTRVSLLDATSKLVYTHQTGRETPGNHRIEVGAESVRDLPAGIYILKADGPMGSVTRKLIKMD